MSHPPLQADTKNGPQMSSNAQSIAPSVIRSASNSSSPDMGIPKDPSYRDLNLAANNIYMRPAYKEFPRYIAGLITYISRDRHSPGPSLDQPNADIMINDHFKANIFPIPGSLSGLKRIDKNPMTRLIPDVGSPLKVSTPVPDMLYGYRQNKAFFLQQAQLFPGGVDVEKDKDVAYLLFVIDFKPGGPSGMGSLWTATNPCLGSSAACVNIIEHTNRQLYVKRANILPIDSTAFSIAMNTTEAQLFISWKHDRFNFSTQRVDDFVFDKPNDYIRFRDYVQNMIDWGMGKQLKDIQNLLDNFIEENKRRAKINLPAAESTAKPAAKSAA
ncbi:hypothetical protein B7494_g7885 [Chlorociboria aeruginascens]|nr:hypothetical protein B7494_g7885 [Chlorociboria aeruginascens]